MILREIIDFINAVPPFRFLNEEQINVIAQVVSVEFFHKGEKIPANNPALLKYIRVIRSGGVMIKNSGACGVMDSLSPVAVLDCGQIFGFSPSEHGDGLDVDIETMDDTIVYVIPMEKISVMTNEVPALRKFFSHAFFRNFPDQSTLEMYSKHFKPADGEGDTDRLLFTTKIEDLIHRKVITSGTGISIRKASEIMSDNNISSLIFEDEMGSPAGIITLRDLRDKVLATGIDPGRQVTEIMSPAAYTVNSSIMTFDALLMMMSHNIHHLIVVDNENRLKGVVTNSDFMVLQGISPISIVKTIEIENSLDSLAAIYGKTVKIISTLTGTGVSARHIAGIITNINERIARRTINIILKDDEKKIFSTLSCLSFGSSGRSEQVFNSAWNQALVYPDQADGRIESELREFCMKLIRNQEDVNVKIGFPPVESNPSGAGALPAGSISEWIGLISSGLLSGDPEKITSASRFLDLKNFYGSEETSTLFKNKIHDRIASEKKYLAAMTLPALSVNPPIGFYNDRVVMSSGEHKGELHISRSCIYPIVDSIRVMALFSKIETPSTIGRIYLLSEKNIILPDLRDDILNGFEFLLNLRIMNQLRKKERKAAPDDLIDPGLLSILEKKFMNDIFRIISRLQAELTKFMKDAGIL